MTSHFTASTFGSSWSFHVRWPCHAGTKFLLVALEQHPMMHHPPHGLQPSLFRLLFFHNEETEYPDDLTFYNVHVLVVLVISC